MIKLFAAVDSYCRARGITGCCPDRLSDRPRGNSSPARSFDFKVEFPDGSIQAKLKVTVNGEDYAAAFGQAGTFVEREDGKEQSALMLRDVALDKPGQRHRRGQRRHAQPQGDVDGLRYRAAQGEERDPVYRRRAVARASRRRRVCFPRALRRARASASLRSTTCRIWRWWRPPARIRSSPIRQTRPAPTPPATRPRSMPWASMPTAPQRPVRRSQGRNHHEPGEATARHEHRYRHQYRSRGCHAGGDGGAYPPPRRL